MIRQFLSSLRGPSVGARADLPDPAVPHRLRLYQFEACPYCQRVLRWLQQHPTVVVERLDVRRERSARNELWEATGRSQVPCLFIDDTPLFESADIVDYLNAVFQAQNASR